MAVAAPRVTVAAMVVVPLPVPVAEHPESVRAASATVVSAEAHVQTGSASGSPPVISMVKWTVWPVWISTVNWTWTVSAAGARAAASGGGGLGAVGLRVPDSEQPHKQADEQGDRLKVAKPVACAPLYVGDDEVDASRHLSSV